MRAQLFRLFLAIGIPSGLLLATHALGANLDRLPAGLGDIVPTLPYLLLASALALALLFSRGRAFIVLLMLGGFHWAFDHPLAWQLHGARLDAEVFRLGIAFLLPLNVAALAGMRERGVLTRHGLLRFAAVALQVGLLLAVATSRPNLLRGLLEATPLGPALERARALGLDVLDLEPLLRADLGNDRAELPRFFLPAPGRAERFIAGHMSAEGNGRVALWIAEHLRAAPNVPGP